MSKRQCDDYRGDKVGKQPKRKPNGKGGRWSEKRFRDRRWMSYRAAKYTAQDKSGATSRSKYFKWHDDYKPVALPKNPDRVYKEEWEGWNVFLNVENTFDGYDRKFGSAYNWRDFWEAVRYVQDLKLGTKREYLELHRKGGIPKDIPMAPDELPIWRDKWKSVGWPGFLGKDLTTQMAAIKNVEKVLCLCFNAEYPRNMVEVIIVEGVLGVKELYGREGIEIVRMYVYDGEDVDRFTGMLGMYGSVQERGIYLFNNLNVFLSECDHELLLYRPPKTT